MAARADLSDKKKQLRLYASSVMRKSGENPDKLSAPTNPWKLTDVEVPDTVYRKAVSLFGERHALSVAKEVVKRVMYDVRNSLDTIEAMSYWRSRASHANPRGAINEAVVRS